jgi:SpoVK/Ycf46/Vps4 family AAA+-type ATPase
LTKPNKKNIPETPEDEVAAAITIISESNVFPKELIDQIARDIGFQTKTQMPGVKPDANDKPKEKIKFNFDMVKTSMDLKNLSKKLKKSKIKNYSLLLYGAPGCGKSYFGDYLAQELGMPVLRKRASDMLSRFVGDSERLISDAFKEAIEKNAILILDEADSMLTDRSKAKQDFQVSSVNTMLTCMEKHPLPFICSTNLKEWLDKASMRRFTFKIKYDEMEEKQLLAGIKEYFGDVKVEKEDLKDLKHITAGDFPLVKKKIDILEDSNYTKDNIIEGLLFEQKEKGIHDSQTIGI